MQLDVFGIGRNEPADMEAGLVTWWSLSGNTALEKLRSEWENAGLDPFFKPKSTGAGTALWKAVSGGIFAKYKEDGLLVRKLPKERSAWAIVRERIRGRRDSANLEYETLMKIWLDGGDGPIFHKAEGQLDIFLIEDDEHNFDSWFDYCADQVTAAFKANQTNLDAREMSNWLIEVLGNYIHGIRLRQRGGIYYVPPDRRSLWEEIIGIIDSMRRDGTGGENLIYTMPVVRSDQVTQAVLDALASEVNACVSTIEEDLTAGIQIRAIKNRKSAALSLDAKLAVYKNLLGDGINLLEIKVEDLRASIAELELAHD